MNDVRSYFNNELENLHLYEIYLHKIDVYVSKGDYE